MHTHILISRSDLQCFSHEDECLLPVTKYKAACLDLLAASGLWQWQLNSRFKGHIVAVGSEEI